MVPRKRPKQYRPVMREPKLVEVMAMPPAGSQAKRGGAKQAAGRGECDAGEGRSENQALSVRCGLNAGFSTYLPACRRWHPNTQPPAPSNPVRHPHAPAASAAHSSQAVLVDISPAATGRKGLLTASISTS